MSEELKPGYKIFPLPNSVCDEFRKAPLSFNDMIRMVYQAGLDAAEQNTRVSSWVSVEDRYPEEGRVIIYTPLTDSMTYRIVEAQFVKTCYDAAYWMPLPEPPIGNA